jgi:hypothetical protein
MSIEAHLNGRIILNQKNPEYKLDGRKADLKTPNGLNYKNIFRKAAKQGCEAVIVNLEKNGDSFDNARAMIRNILKHPNVHPSIQEVIIISKDKKVTLLKRDKI